MGICLPVIAIGMAIGMVIGMAIRLQSIKVMDLLVCRSIDKSIVCRWLSLETSSGSRDIGNWHPIIRPAPISFPSLSDLPSRNLDSDRTDSAAPVGWCFLPPPFPPSLPPSLPPHDDDGLPAGSATECVVSRWWTIRLIGRNWSSLGADNRRAIFSRFVSLFPSFLFGICFLVS